LNEFSRRPYGASHPIWRSSQGCASLPLGYFRASLRDDERFTFLTFRRFTFLTFLRFTFLTFRGEEARCEVWEQFFHARCLHNHSGSDWDERSMQVHGDRDSLPGRFAMRLRFSRGRLRPDLVRAERIRPPARLA
jgi:hypothetical protein